MITTRHIVVPVSGTAGSATGDVVDARPSQGRVVGIYLKYTTQPAGTCVVSVKSQGTEAAPSFPVLTITNSNTNAWYRPLTVQHTTAGAVATYDGTHNVLSEIPVDDFLEVTVSGGNNGQVDAWILLEQDYP